MKSLLCVFIFLTILQYSWQNYCTRQRYGVVGRRYYSYCACRFLWWCTHRRTGSYAVYGYYSVRVCCPGWRGSYCNDPICNPRCGNGGTCTAPNTCKCRIGYTGSTCGTVTCSHLKPCFPGSCEYPNKCYCDYGFQTDTCREFQPIQKPDITYCKSTFINLRRSNNIELYRYVVDIPYTNITDLEYLWCNRKEYNFLNVEFGALFMQPFIDYTPQYVSSYGFGIVEASVNVRLTKIPRKGANSVFESLNKTYNCNPTISPTNPEQRDFSCNITEKNFDRILEHGDNLTITAKAVSGGYRKLLNLNNNMLYENQHYTGQLIEKTMLLKFDLYPPYHCLENKTCTDTPLAIKEAITKKPFQIEWKGWKDDMSGVSIYTWQVYKLQPNQYTGNLTEINPRFPFYKTDIYTGNFTNFPVYTPPESGMYSIVLEVADAANNTRYARELVLYDNTSSITINKEMKMKVVSAESETNFRWQSNLDLPIETVWTGHFENKFHVENKLLYYVDRFHLQTYNDIDFGLGIQKNVEYKFEAVKGGRTLKLIPNVHGIVKFKYGFEKDHNGGDDIGQSPLIWHDVDEPLKETQSFSRSRTDGDTVRIWIQAFDTLGNMLIDSVDVNFDSSKPEMEKIQFLENINGTQYAFGSKVTLEAFDRESGIHKIQFRFVDNDTGNVHHDDHIPGNKSHKTSLPRSEGECTPTKECFYVAHSFEINNCWMVVDKDKLPTQVFRLEIMVYNQALIPKTDKILISNLTQYDGIDKYSGPRNLRVSRKLDNGVRLKWDISPSCYEKTEITVVLKTAAGDTEKRFISANADWYDIVGLEPITNYTLKFITHYGKQQSDPVELTFTTLPATEFALSVGAAAGIGISVILIIALSGILVVVIVLWRRGRLRYTKERIRHRMSVYFSKSDLPKRKMGYDNCGYGDEEDIYIYGGMSFKKKQSWQIPHSQIVLEEQITSGKFADIYKAKRTSTNENSVVVAKIMKSNYTPDDLLLMNAKINFHSTTVGKHPNILAFIGAVIDNDTFGPYILFEYCEIGPLKGWLVKQRNNVKEDTEETFYRLAFDICKGMQYLASKKIKHRRLAARNILLNSNMDAKVAGFDLSKGDMETKDENDEGKETQEKTRIPIKWLPPECLISMKNSTTQSDVWSFGIVLWEIFSCGLTPYPNIRSHDVEERLKEGYRMERPEFASDFFYDMMKKCWEEKPKSRPSFKSLASDITRIFKAEPTDDYYYAPK